MYSGPQDHNENSATERCRSFLADVQNGQVEAVVTALQTGMDPNQFDAENLLSPLLIVAKTDFVPVATALLAHGADPKRANLHGVTPLHWACARQKAAMAKLFLEHGADLTAIEQDGWLPLHWAAFRGNAELVKLLSDAGSPLDRQDKDGWTPLHLAGQQGHQAAAKCLLDSGAQCALPDGLGRTPADLATSQGHPELAELINNTQQPR